jgi:hypothetical protein
MNIRNLLIATLGVAALTGAATSASAYTWHHWRHHHGYANPVRRVQVNERLTNENRRIAEEHREGHLTAGQAHYLHARVKHIRVRTKRAAIHQGGALTPTQQHNLNGQASAVGSHVPR